MWSSLCCKLPTGYSWEPDMVLYNVQSAFRAACPAKMLQSKAAAALRGSASRRSASSSVAGVG